MGLAANTLANTQGLTKQVYAGKKKKSLADSHNKEVKDSMNPASQPRFSKLKSLLAKK